MVREISTMADWLSTGTDIRVDQLRDYLKTLNEQLVTVASDYDQRIENEAKQIQDEQQRAEFYEFSSDRHWAYAETFPRILFNSFHLAAYAFFEAELISIASMIGRKQKQAFAVTDFGTRDYLSTASLYVERLTRVRPQDFRSWEALTVARWCRNLIVHSNGTLRKQKDIDFAERHGFIDRSQLDPSVLRSTWPLSLTYEYCHSLLDTIKVFFRDLYSAVGQYL